MATALDLGIIAILACLAWWASTGLILSLVGQSERTYRWSMLGATTLAAAAVGMVIHTRNAETIGGTIIGFAAALIIWGAVEMAFLMGYVVGPRRETCPRGIAGWNRFKACWGALAHHELLLATCLLALFALVAGAANAIAFETFALLWAMRLSTKLNIFLGVSNAGEDLLPRRVAYLKSYFAKAPMNALFPISVTAATTSVVLLAAAALGSTTPAHSAVGSALLATFAALAVLEHWLLVLPLPATSFWPWAGRHAPEETSQPAPLR